ncbi:uncharacterized protein ACBT57_005169 isoform 1-T1 [Dama dama]
MSRVYTTHSSEGPHPSQSDLLPCIERRLDDATLPRDPIRTQCSSSCLFTRCQPLMPTVVLYCSTLQDWKRNFFSCSEEKKRKCKQMEEESPDFRQPEPSPLCLEALSQSCSLLCPLLGKV